MKIEFQQLIWNGRCDMKNPLGKRHLRELKSDFGKYFVIFIFMVGLSGIGSGFFVAQDSMAVMIAASDEKYNVENGGFESAYEVDEDTISIIEEEEVTIYENFYVEEKEKENKTTLRIFENRKKINKAAVIEGELPNKSGDIAIDRLYATNNEFEVGDKLSIGDEEFKITGYVALGEYTAMFQNNNDMMFDASNFGVALVVPEDFEEFESDDIHYNYAWKYDENIYEADDEKAKEMADDFLDVLSEEVFLKSYTPAYSNQAIQFARDDLGKDGIVMQVFIYLVMAILAFVTGIIATATIVKEANIIGTLRAIGYKRWELLVHYLKLPVLTIFVATLIGNVLGYTYLKNFLSGAYYNSYCFPNFATLWNTEAFIKSSVIPSLMVIIIVALLLSEKLRLSPLKFIRRDLKKSKNAKTLYLSEKIKIFTRFRLRIILHNLPSYIVLVIGVLLANIIILFGFVFAPTLEKFSEDILENNISKYQYILKAPIETEEEAEKYATYSLKDKNIALDNEKVVVYGIVEDSEYVDIDNDKVYISDGYSLKYDIEVGDKLELKEVYENEEYTVEVGGIYEYPSTISIFMGLDDFNEMFDNEDDYFNGYFTDVKLDDIDKKYVATVVDEEALTKVSRQLNDSMGSMMSIFTAFGIAMFILIIYLLTKVVIDKNKQNISLTKILGYRNDEINKLYVRTNTIVTVVSLIATIPLASILVEQSMLIAFSMYPQYLPFYMPGETYIKTFVLGLLAYCVVAFAQTKKAKAVSLDIALKNIE